MRLFPMKNPGGGGGGGGFKTAPREGVRVDGWMEKEGKGWMSAVQCSCHGSGKGGESGDKDSIHRLQITHIPSHSFPSPKPSQPPPSPSSHVFMFP